MPHHYRIVPVKPAAHLFDVTLTIEQPATDQVLWMPAWIPGSYLVRNFARNLIDMTARDAGGEPIRLEQTDKQHWTVPGAHSGPVSLNYRVYAWDRSVRAAHLDQTHGYFNGSSVFLAVQGQEHMPCRVSIEPPATPVDGRWKVATTLPRETGDTWAFGDFLAADYDELTDHPVELADFEPTTFEAEGVRHDIVLSGRHRADTQRLARDLEAICSHHIRFWGVAPPMPHYLFMTMVTGDGYGGLEHRTSTSLMAKRDDLPAPTLGKPDAGYLNYLGLCSHEYFHSWNVKRLKPAAFLPYDLTRENYTELLWWFEGMTSYYDDLGVLRAGCSTVEQYLEQVAQTMTRVHRGQGRFRQSIAESSFNAWTKFYLQDENAPNAIVSYYAKGALFALYLDLEIRRRTDNRQSLDDLMRAAWNEWRDTGMPERGVPSLAKDIIRADLSDVFELGVHGREDLPLTDSLSHFGITVEWETPVALSMPGGKKAFLKPGQTSLGAVFDKDPGGARVRAVLEDSPAQKAGLSAGDLVVAVDSLQTDQSRIDQQAARFAAGESFSLHYFRYDELRETEVVAETGPKTTCVLSVNNSDQARAWLGDNVHFEAMPD